MERAGLDPIVFHAAGRNMFASHLAQNGRSLYAIQEILGHKDPSTTLVPGDASIDAADLLDSLDG